MTSAISVSNRHTPRRAFTLIEMLVVIGIMVALAAIAIPTLMHAYKQADKTRTAANLQVIGVALEAYKGDFGDYPRLVRGGTQTIDTSPNRGAFLLCRALVGPDALANDGADGMGFRVRTGGQGKVYGPYFQPDRIKMINTNSAAPAGNYELADANGVAILYYPTNPVRGDLTAANAYIGNALTPTPVPYVNAIDNTGIFDVSTSTNLALFEIMLGETVTQNGKIDAGEIPISVPYLLWAAGNDAKFGPLSTSPSDVAACDDVTNISK